MVTWAFLGLSDMRHGFLKDSDMRHGYFLNSTGRHYCFLKSTRDIGTPSQEPHYAFWTLDVAESLHYMSLYIDYTRLSLQVSDITKYRLTQALIYMDRVKSGSPGYIEPLDTCKAPVPS